MPSTDSTANVRLLYSLTTDSSALMSSNSDIPKVPGSFYITGDNKIVFDKSTTQRVIINAESADYADELDGWDSTQFLRQTPASVNNALVRFDGVQRQTKNTGIFVDDSNNITGVNKITVNQTGLFVNHNVILGAAYNNPALTIGGNYDEVHMEIDKDTIQGKNASQLASILKLNPFGGNVQIGSGGVTIAGPTQTNGLLDVNDSIVFSTKSYGTSIPMSGQTGEMFLQLYTPVEDGLPRGGSIGQLLYKTTDSTDYDAAWLDETIGANDKPIYINNGVPTASTANIGSATRPVYVNAGVITPLTYTVKRLYYPSSTTSMEASSHYVDGTHLAVNQTTLPTNNENFFVNGTSYFSGVTKFGGATTFNNTTNFKQTATFDTEIAGTARDANKVNHTLTLKINDQQIGTFNGSSDLTYNVTLDSLGLSQALKFAGVTTTAMTDGRTTAAVTIDGKSYSPSIGDVVIYSDSEFVWTGSAWERLGRDSSWALSSIKVTGTGELGGGGDLTADRTITHNESGVTAGSYGDAAAQTPGYGATFKVPYITVNKYGHVTGLSEHTVKIPASDQTDYRVTQSATTTTDYRPILFGYTNSTDPTALDTSVTEQSYVTETMYAQPSSGTLFATKFKGNLQGNVSGNVTGNVTGNLTGIAGEAQTLVWHDLSTNTDLNTITETGLYGVFAHATQETLLNNPLPTGNGIIMPVITRNGTTEQIALGTNKGGIAIRRQSSGTWSNWVIALDTNNYTDYTVTKTGTGASGTWGINISGYAKVSGAQDNHIVRFDGTDGKTQNSAASIDDSGNLTAVLLKSISNGNTVTIGSQNTSWTHIYNSADVPFIFNKSVLSTDGDLGSTSYPWKNIYTKGSAITYCGTKANTAIINFIDNTSDANGNGIRIGGGGLVVVGAGESSGGLVTAESLSAGNESLYLSADNGIFLYSNCDTIANRKGIVYDTAGALRPVTNNTLSLGASAQYWGNAYITTVHGSLDGNAATASEATHAALASAVGVDATMKMYAEQNNEVNFGGTNNSNTIYFGDRAKDSKPIPSKFVFGSSTGTASLQAGTYYAGSGTTYYVNGATSNLNSLKVNASLIGKENYSYGPTLPASAVEGQMFFQTIDQHDPIILYRDIQYGETLPGSPVEGMLYLQVFDDETEGIPGGGANGQILVKDGSTDGRTKWQTASVGAANKPIYLTSGVPTACSSTVGSASKPVYMNGGTITVCNDTLGVSISGNAATATKATQDGSGNTITSKYVTIDTAQTISGGKTFSGTTTFSGNVFIASNRAIIQNQIDTSNYTTPIQWYKGGVSQNTYNPSIGQHNTGGTGTGSITILPYATATSPWRGTVGLFITEAQMNFIGHKFIDSTGKVYAAVWNDYAEYRQSDVIEPGRVIHEVGDDSLALTDARMIPGSEIISDTFGYAEGETEDAKTPVAVAGRVLAYPYEDREEFRKNIGRPVCSGPNGTVSIMTDEEYKEKGYCAIGTISAVPDYDEWGTGNVKVNGRVWIRMR